MFGLRDTAGCWIWVRRSGELKLVLQLVYPPLK